MKKETKIYRLVLFNLNLVSSSTEMGFVQKKLNRLFQKKKGREGNVFCQNLIYMTKNIVQIIRFSIREFDRKF